MAPFAKKTQINSVISSHTLPNVWLFINAGIKVNPRYQKGPRLTQAYVLAHLRVRYQKWLNHWLCPNHIDLTHLSIVLNLITIG